MAQASTRQEDKMVQGNSEEEKALFKELTQQIKQQQRNDVVEMCDNILERYDWDKALERHVEGL